MERVWIRLAGRRGEVGSKVCDTVVVAVVSLPALPCLLVCENSVCGGLVLVFGSGLVADGTGTDWTGEVDVTEVEAEILEDESSESAALLLSRERRGVPAVMNVSTDWLSEVRHEEAAEWRSGMMEGPGRRWAFVRWAQVQMARGPRVY